MSRLKNKISINIVAAAMAAAALGQGAAPAGAGEAAAWLPAVFSAVAPRSLGERVASHAAVLGAAVARSWIEAASRRAEATIDPKEMGRDAGGKPLHAFSHAAPGVDPTIRTSLTSRVATPAATAPAGDVFGSVAISFRRLPALQKIKPSYRQMASTAGGGPVLVACPEGGCPTPLAAVTAAIDALQGAGFAHKVGRVNAIVNGYVAYRRDVDNYGVVDHWATPGETLARRSGDCEDYAILKMALLARLGVPASSMSVVVLRDESRDLFHAVLSLRTNKGHLILDNVHDRVLVDRDLPHYLPLYSISAGKGFIHGRKSGSERLVAGGVPFSAIAPGEGPLPAMAPGAARVRR